MAVADPNATPQMAQLAQIPIHQLPRLPRHQPAAPFSLGLRFGPVARFTGFFLGGETGCGAGTTPSFMGEGMDTPSSGSGANVAQKSINRRLRV